MHQLLESLFFYGFTKKFVPQFWSLLETIEALLKFNCDWFARFVCVCFGWKIHEYRPINWCFNEGIFDINSLKDPFVWSCYGKNRAERFVFGSGCKDFIVVDAVFLTVATGTQTYFVTERSIVINFNFEDVFWFYGFLIWLVLLKTSRSQRTPEASRLRSSPWKKKNIHLLSYATLYTLF